MALYAMADFHLCMGVQDKPMDVFGGRWDGYIDKIYRNCTHLLTNDDTLLIPGDISWGTYTHQAAEDFKFISSLPGTKIISRGNHDYWWTTKNKLDKLMNELGITDIKFLHNNFYAYNDTAICGCRGWIYSATPENVKIYNRELLRLEYSLNAAAQNGFNEKIAVMHYPPYKTADAPDENIFRILEKYNVKKCLYGHLHGNFDKPILSGVFGGINFSLISADYLNFMPKKILD